MLTLSEIEKLYPEHIRGFRRGMIREYLQYKILQSVFDSPYGQKLSFLGGTALRIVHGNARFSEDLDFDNFGLTQEEFGNMADVVRSDLESEGYSVETKNIFKGAFRCYVRMPGILFENKLSELREEKILIQLDTLSHGFEYAPESVTLNKFEVFSFIRVTPLDILLSQKIYAAFNRKRKKGRDFFDIVFLLSKTKPNYGYLKEKMGISDEEELRKKLSKLCEEIDLSVLAEDVRSFLFFPRDVKKVELFCRYIQTAELA